jgi:hypothetical protein
VLIISIPEREIEQREDLRAERVFTIDPPTAKDLDDALDVSKLQDGTFRVRVHIADVSYFGELDNPFRQISRADDRSQGKHSAGQRSKETSYKRLPRPESCSYVAASAIRGALLPCARC